MKVTVNEDVSFTYYAFGIWLPDCSKLTINQKNDNDVTICRHDVIAQCFWRYFVSLVRFSYWSKFLVKIKTGSEVMTVYFCKRLTRNLEIGNTPVWVLPYIWRLWWVRDTKFSTDIPNKTLLNALKCQGYSFYRFIEEIKQRIKAKTTKLHKYDERNNQFLQNRLFPTNPKLLFEKIVGKSRQNNVKPNAEESRKLWNDNWS